MKRIILKFAVLFLLVFMLPQRVYADDFSAQSYAQEIFDYLDGGDSEIIQTAEEIAVKSLEFSFEDVSKKAVSVFTQEVKEQTGILKKLAAISLLCGFMGSMGEAFGKKEVSEMGFFVCIITLIYMVISSVRLQCDFVYETIEKISTDIKIALPAVITAAVSSGRSVSAPLMMPVMMGYTAFTVFFAKNIALPFISASAVLECINCISEKNMLSTLCELIRKVVSVLLKGTAFLFVSVISLQRMGTGNVSALVFKTAKSAVGAVPVVGDIMKSSVETVSAVSSLINNSLASAAAVMIAVSLAVPVVKLAVMYLMYKLSASFIEPVTDKRIVRALNCAGDISALLLAMMFTVGISYAACMFIILLSF